MQRQSYNPAKIYVNLKNKVTIDEIIVIFDDNTEIHLNTSARYIDYNPKKRPDFFVTTTSNYKEEIYFIDYINKSVNKVLTVDKFYSKNDFLMNSDTYNILYKINDKFYIKNLLTHVEKEIKFDLEPLLNKPFVPFISNNAITVGNEYLKIDDNFSLLLHIDTQKCLNEDAQKVFASRDFLNGKTNFYCLCISTRNGNMYYIYNKDNILLKSIFHKPFIVTFKDFDIFNPDNLLFTEQTKYLSEITKDKINFYYVDNVNGEIKYIDCLNINPQNNYHINLLSQNGKFLIFEEKKSNTNKKLDIYIYNVESKTTEYIHKDIPATWLTKITLNSLETFIKSLILYLNDKKPYYLQLVENKCNKQQEIHSLTTLNTNTCDFYIIEPLDITNNVYVATKDSDFKKRFLIKIEDRNNYKILTDEFSNATFHAVTDDIFIISVKNVEQIDIYLRKLSSNSFVKMCEVQSLFPHMLNIQIFSAQVNNLLFVLICLNVSQFMAEGKSYGFIYDIEKNEIHTPPKDEKAFLVRLFIEGAYDYFGVINNDNTISIYDNKGEKVCNLTDKSVLFNNLPKYKIGDNVYPYSMLELQKSIKHSQTLYNEIKKGFTLQNNSSNNKNNLNLDSFKI